jgi:hypothetical protein
MTPLFNGLAATILCVIAGCSFCTAGAIIATDGSLVREATGVVYDTDTGLEWYPGPDRGMTWGEAQDWIATLTLQGGGWRMPARRELVALKRIGDGVRNLTPLVPTTGYWIWAGETRDAASRWLFGFGYGGEGWSGQPPADGGRAMAVRIRQKHD